MPTQITSAGITFNDTTSLTSATLVANSVGTTQITNGSVTAAKLGTTEQKQICKAWVNFDGTTSPGTIRSSFNVSSVTKNGTGDYSINFTTALADSNYSVQGMTCVESAEADCRIISVNLNRTFSTTTCSVVTSLFSVRENRSQVYIAIFGN
jgi:hypothetical protein